MTISIAWTRKRQNYEELVFVSDSRLTGGKKFDACPKILALPRGDCAIAFANTSGDAFSMMIQLSLAIDAYPPARKRRFELNLLLDHAVSVFNGMLEKISLTEIKGNPGLAKTDAEFLFGGYSWREKKFRLWAIHYSSAIQRFVSAPARSLTLDRRKKTIILKGRQSKRFVKLGNIAFAGDQARAAKKLLFKRLSSEVASGFPPYKIDMEPFEVVRDMLRDPSLQQEGVQGSIGGAPQVLKVFQYSRTSSYAVFWPDRSGVPHLHGRPSLPYENLDQMSLDPDTLRSVYLGSEEALAQARKKAEMRELECDPNGGVKLILALLKDRLRRSAKLI